VEPLHLEGVEDGRELVIELDVDDGTDDGGDAALGGIARWRGGGGSGVKKEEG
jgi:hypothetical protein